MSSRKGVSRYIGRRNVKANNRPRLPKVLGEPTPGPSAAAFLVRVFQSLLDSKCVGYFTKVVTGIGGVAPGCAIAIDNGGPEGGDMSVSDGGLQFVAFGAAPFPVVDQSIAWNGVGASPTFTGGGTASAFYVGMGCILPFPEVSEPPYVVLVGFRCAMDVSNVVDPSLFSWNLAGDYFAPSFCEWVTPYSLRLTGWVASADTGLDPDTLGYRTGLSSQAPVALNECRVLRGLMGFKAHAVEIAVP